MSIFLHLLLYVVSFMAVWMGANLAVSSLSKLIRAYRLPPFTTSFFILGILTSLPEITIGFLSVVSKEPVIFVGNLLGGSILLFLLIIPLLGLLGNGVRLPKLLDQKDLLAILIVVLAPALCTIDQHVAVWEGAALIILYVMLCIYLFRQHGLLKHLFVHHGEHTGNSGRWRILVVKIIVGILVLTAASQQIISSTMYFSKVLELSPFFVSLFVVAIGTNIPELSIIFTSIARKRKDIAFADYLGSATANTPLFGILTLFNAAPIDLPLKVTAQSLSIGFGLLLFFYYARSKTMLSRNESVVLLGCYIFMIMAEILPRLL